MNVILLTLFIISNSLTLSPVGITYHFKNDYAGYENYRFSPNALDKSQQTTWHPMLSLTYKSQYMQYNVFYMRDSYFKHSFGGLLGPKYDLFSFFSIGLVGGVVAKQHGPTRCVNNICATVGAPQVPKISTEDFNIIPIGALTASIKIPLTKQFSLETNSALTPVFIHNTLGVRWDW